MNLKSEQLEELNALLSDKKLDLPAFRREVTRSGNNYAWLQRSIMIRNEVIPERLKELLLIK